MTRAARSCGSRTGSAAGILRCVATAPDVGDPDSLPDSSDPTGPCPRCGRVAAFDLKGHAPLTYRTNVFAAGGSRLPIQRASILECNGCGLGIVVIEDEYVGGVRYGGSGASTWHGIHWWPTPGATAFGSEVPAEIADSYGEGLRCLSAGAPNGAVAMFRTAMTWMVNDKSSAAAKAKGDLKDKVKQMVADGGLTATVGSWVDHVRLYGNAGVHPDLFGDVSLEEAQDVASLTATLIELLYTTPATIAKRQAERRP
jgi:hypothetical protein